MQNSSEDARDRIEKRDLALKYYENGKNKSAIDNKRMQEEAIAEFKKLFAIVESYHNLIYPTFLGNEALLPNAHEWCGSAYLKLWQGRAIDNPEESYLEKTIVHFLSAAYYRSQGSHAYKQSPTRWEEVKSYCNDYMEQYKQLKTSKTSSEEDFILIEERFNKLIGDVDSSTKVKDAITGLAIIDFEHEFDNFRQEILVFYARLYEYRGYSYKQVKKFYRAKFDLERACEIYGLILQDTLETDDVISAIKKIIQALDQEAEDAKRRSAATGVVEHHRRSGFFRNFAMYFLQWLGAWLGAIYGFFKMIFSGVLTSFFKSLCYFFSNVSPHLISLIKLDELFKSLNKDKDNRNS